MNLPIINIFVFFINKPEQFQPKSTWFGIQPTNLSADFLCLILKTQKQNDLLFSILLLVYKIIFERYSIIDSFIHLETTEQNRNSEEK